jgi:calcineurin-like phosphoesterase
MAHVAVAFLGDIVGAPGRSAAAGAVPILRERHRAALVIANGENAKHGSGISPDNYRELRRAGIDAVTLGDHWLRERGIAPVLEDAQEPITRPANLSARAPGKRRVRLEVPGPSDRGGPLYVLTVLGRIFMPIPADSPFDAIDREIGEIARTDENAMVIVEIHAEATSEKAAIAWHCAMRYSGATPPGESAAPAAGSPRVVAVVGTHTHVQTADARIVERQLAAITDLGMTGPHRSIIGRSIPATLEVMVNQTASALNVASDDPRAQGVVVTLDTANRRAVSVAAFDLPVC